MTAILKHVVFFINLILLFLTAAPTNALKNFDDWEHQRVALNDVSIHFRYAGSGPPLLLVHGNPQFSLTWRIIGPILAENFTVIAPDNRGAGDSSLPPDGNYSATASAEDLKGILDFLNITSTYVFSHDKGVGMTYALAAKYPSLVKMMGISEYGLPGFGYEQVAALAPYWDLYANWQLSFFAIPDAAEFFIRGREREMLQWYFFHGSYSGPTAFSEDVVSRYATSISKPGFLRAMFGPFDNRAITADADFFKGTLGRNPLQMPVLALGGEASFGAAIGPVFQNVTENMETDVVPKAGHWIADENPTWVARRVFKFLAQDKSPLPHVDLSYLKDKVTLTVGYFGTLGNAALGGA
ncbi:putative soluble epoxide hydrolase protein [Phaeoacremonium minimum UCRPA7]|uniref:Putative soluble epoxide hydrolase protein n=1 Tax=Phaeoacremonium minimum (strain UCR-PA7) TaxID=1286976 RepID=R8BPS1_PHAM7|nr:putative soluble epoxide hydrolase protein [Phaeoacremonium minimum UCRPA7]EOO01300.1 putative soluble epoxide hydrolase protein [Phaeoacremonium minimum UCRPA7]